MVISGSGVSDAHVFPGCLTQLSFQSQRLLFSHASVEMRGENMSERKFASTRYQNHNHQVMSLTRSPLSHPGKAYVNWILKINNSEKKFDKSLQNGKSVSLVEIETICKRQIKDGQNSRICS